MKKLLLCVIMMLGGAFILNGQTEAGKVMIGTSMDLFGSTMITNCGNTAGFAIISSEYKRDDFDSEPYQTTVLNLSPRLGFFVVDNLMAGAEVSIEYYKFEDVDDPNTLLAFGPFARYYFGADYFRPFVTAGVNLGQMKDSSKDQYNIFSFTGGAGGAFFFNDQVSLDLMVKYSHFTMKEKDAERNAREVMDTFGFGIGLSMFL